MKKFSIIVCLLNATCSFIYAQDWHLIGNSGTTPGTNFVGTTDAQALLFKVNNQPAGYLGYNTTQGKAAFGYQALLTATGIRNSAFGYKALFGTSSGAYNTAVGAYVLYSNRTGFNNTALGYLALNKNTTGY